MITTAPRRSLPQYNETDARIHQIATDVVAGHMTERQGRADIWVLIVGTDLVAVTVSHWLSKQSGRGISHHRDDLVLRADDWVARAITGLILDPGMRDVGTPASLIDLQRLADGASAIGYLRLAIGRQMPNLLRGLLRANTTTHADSDLASFGVRGGDDEGYQKLPPRPLHYAQVTAGENGDDEIRDQVAIFNSRSYAKSEQHRSWELGQLAEAICSVPPARRPLAPSERHRLMAVLDRDHLTAREALYGRGELVALFADHTLEERDSLTHSGMFDLWSYALARAALDDVPRPSRPTSSAARREVAGRALQAGMPRSAAKAAVDAILDAELAPVGPRRVTEHPELSGAASSWVEVVEPICAQYPGVLGPDVRSAREYVLGLLIDDEPDVGYGDLAA